MAYWLSFQSARLQLRGLLANKSLARTRETKCQAQIAVAAALSSIVRPFTGMSKWQPHLGAAPAGKYRARADDGTDVSPNQAVFPIVSQESDGTFVAIGTGFFVAENGIFVTAAHVVSAVLNEHGKATAPFGMFQFAPNNTYRVRPIHRATRHLVADLAVGVASPMHHKVDGTPLPNKVLKLAMHTPDLGRTVCTYAYPRTLVQAGRPQQIEFLPAFVEGVILEHLPNGRDKVMLPGPCFRTSMAIHGGASGGPVVAGGAVFAVNSTGIDNSAVSYVSCVSSALDLAITDVKLPGEAHPRNTTLRELISLGFVSTG